MALSSQELLDMFGTEDAPDSNTLPDPSVPQEPSPTPSGPVSAADITNMFGSDAETEAPAEIQEDEEAGILAQIKGGFHDFMSRELTSQALRDAERVSAREEGREYSGDIAQNQFGGISQAVKTSQAKADPEFKAQYVEEAKEALKARISKAASHRKKGEEIPLSKATQEFLDENSEKSIWEAFTDAPFTIIAELGARSAVSMVPGLAMGAVGGAAGGGPAGFAAGMGAGSARVEFAASLVDFLQKAGVDTENPDAIVEAVQNKDLMNQANEYAMRRSAVIGGVDALAGLIGAKQLAPGVSNRLAREFANVTGQTVIQSGMGAAGEAGAQLATGEELQPRQIAAEAAGELVTAPVDVATAAYSGARSQPSASPEMDEMDAMVRDIEAVDDAFASGIDEAKNRGGDALDQIVGGSVAATDVSTTQGDVQEQADQLAMVQQAAMAEEQRRADEVLAQEAEAAKAIEQEAAAKRADEIMEQMKARRVELGLEKAPEEPLPVEEKSLPEKTEAPINPAMMEAFKKAKSEPAKPKKSRKKDVELDDKVVPESTQTIENKENIDEQAQEAATSPTNDLPQPSEAQKSAGNYKKGHINVQGNDITIENPIGSTRSGVDASGKKWSQRLKDHYGYIKRTEGADGEQVDVFVGKNPESDRVFVVDQIDQQTGEFDEHKVMMGFNNQLDAVRGYKRNFEKGWNVGPVSEMTQSEFKEWLKTGDNTRPVQPQKISEAIATPASAEQVQAIAARKASRRKAKPSAPTKTVSPRFERARSRFPVQSQKEADTLLGARRERKPAITKPIMTKEAAERAVSGVKKDLAGADINVVGSINELPSNIYQRIKNDNATSAKGVFDIGSGKVYVIGENHADADDVVATALHEAVAHKGLRAVLQKDFDSTMDSVYSGLKDNQGFKDMIKAKGLAVDNAEAQRIAAEEYAALLAEKDERLPLHKKVNQAIRKSLRKLGLQKSWSDDDIKSLLSSAKKELRKTPLSEVSIISEVEIEDTGEVIEIEESAEVALRQLQKRKGMIDKLRGCVR